MLNTTKINSKPALMECEYIMAPKQPINIGKCSITIYIGKRDTRSIMAKHFNMPQLKGKCGLNALSLTSCCHSPLPNAVKVLMGCVSLDYLAYIPPRLSL